MTAAQLDPLTLGLVLAVLGMGGTLLTLYVLSLIMSLLTRLFPEGTAGRDGATGGEGEGKPSTPSPQPPTPT